MTQTVGLLKSDLGGFSLEHFKTVFAGGDLHLGDFAILLIWTSGACVWMYTAIWGKGKRKSGAGRFFQTLLAVPIGLLFVCVGSLSIYGLVSGANNLRHILQQGAYHSVEGPVTQFDPMPLAGHKRESFVIKGIKFSYSDFVMTSASTTRPRMAVQSMPANMFESAICAFHPKRIVQTPK